MDTLDDLFARLDPEQRAAAEWTPNDGNLRVVANAGSGKTTTLVALTASLLLRHHIKPENLYVLTFTKKAGEELKSRLAKTVPRHLSDRTTLGTFHAAALARLRENDPEGWSMSRCIDMPPKTRATGVPSAAELWRSICSYGRVPGSGRDSLKLPLDAAWYRKQIDRWRCNSWEQFCEIDVPPGMNTKERAEYERAWDYFIEAKAALKVWDFADLLAQWRTLLLESPSPEAIVLVDEAQDNNIVQLDIVRALAGKTGRIVLIGDDKQTIYQFRGAYPALFRSAESELGAQTRRITTNYRSDPRIIDFANQFISKCPWTADSPSKSFREGKCAMPLSTLRGVSPLHEADEVARQIADAIVDEGVSPSEFVILTRTNAAKAAFESALFSRNIPTVVLGGGSVFTSREAEKVMAYLNLSGPNGSVEDLDKILNVPKRFIPRTFLGEVHAALPGRELVPAMKAALNTSTMKPACRKGVLQLISTIESLKTATWTCPPDTDPTKDGSSVCARVLQLVAPEVGETPEEADEDNRGTFETLIALARLFAGPAELAAFASACASGVMASGEGEKSSRCVTISTIHKVKGLEWDRVFFSCSAREFPNPKSKDPSEEERLFYVALTRARDQITFTSSDAMGGLSKFLPPIEYGST